MIRESTSGAQHRGLPPEALAGLERAALEVMHRRHPSRRFAMRDKPNPVPDRASGHDQTTLGPPGGS